MNIVESIKVAINAIFSNKMRSLLTMLGIIIGISSVITIVAIGEGSQKMIDKEFEQFGTDKAQLSMNWAYDYEFDDLMTYDDIEILKEIFPDEIEIIVPNNSATGKVKYKNKEREIRLRSANQDFRKLEKVKLISGRYLIDEDVRGRRMVGVIDKKTAVEIFGRVDVVGEYLDMKVNDKLLNFAIIGVFEEPESMLFMSGGNSGTFHTPYTTIKDILDGGEEVFSADIVLNKDYDRKELVKKITLAIERRHDSIGKDMYMVQTAEEELESINSVTTTITVVIGAIAAISLLVGGIGVMNIMFVSVTERTREIGIRKAIGARRKDILLQFLVESVIVSGIGGIIGTILGISLAFVIASFIKISPSISLKTISIAWLFSAGVGVFFGIYPANKASKLDPIEALRYE